MTSHLLQGEKHLSDLLSLFLANIDFLPFHISENEFFNNEYKKLTNQNTNQSVSEFIKIQRKLEKQLAKRLIKYLNLIHGTNYSIKTWYIYVGYWLRRYSNIITNRFFQI